MISPLLKRCHQWKIASTAFCRSTPNGADKFLRAAGAGNELDLVNRFAKAVGGALERGSNPGNSPILKLARRLFAGAEGLGSEAALRLTASGNAPVEGIYEFVSASGRKYVGQSGDIAARIKSHVASGKLLEQDLRTLKSMEVLGGKINREVSEQLRILDLGGVRGRGLVPRGPLENIINPIGPDRAYLLPEHAQVTLGYQ